MQCYRDNTAQGMKGPSADAVMDQKGSCKAYQRTHVLLVFDMFKIHLKDDILKENNISQVLILGGCMSKIQPLDVCLNKTFTAYIHGVCEEYKAGQAQSTHIASQIPTALRKDILSGL